jgi:gas vesicle protein
MADQTLRTGNRAASDSQPSGLEKAAGAAKNATDEALSAGRELKDKAVDMAGSSSEAIKDRASDFVEAAEEVASKATDKLKQTVDGQKNAGAEYVGSVADMMRRAAREFDSELPIAGTYIRKAASQVETVSDSIRNGNFNDLISGAQSFARRQPTAFLGMAVLAGFGLVRFLKSSADSTGRNEVREGNSRRQMNFENRWDAGNEGQRNEFSR